MGDDGEMFSSSEFKQPSPDGAGELKDAAQILDEKLETSDVLAVAEEKAGADETGDLRAAAEVEVGGDSGLEDSALEENSGGELEEEDAVTNEEGSTEVPAVVEVEPLEVAASDGNIENRDSTVGAGEEDTIFNEYVNSPADELGVAEGEAKTFDPLVESSFEMTLTETGVEKSEEVREAAVEESYMETPVAENEMEKADVEEAASVAVAVAENEIEMVEEMLNADAEESPAVAESEFEMVEEKLKADVEEASRLAFAENEIEMVEEKLKADAEESSAAAENEFEMVEEMLKVDAEEPVAAAESEIERVAEMLNADVGHFEEVPKTEAEVADEIMDMMEVKEDVVVADTELGDIDSAQELENVDGHETAPVVDDADTKQLPFTAAAGKEAVVEDSKDGEDGTIAANLECVSKDDIETETELVKEEMSIGKAEPEAETGEGAYAKCSPNSDEVEKTVAAGEDPDMIDSDMDYKTVAGEETSNDDKLASSQEEAAEDMVAEEGSPLDEQELVVEQEEALEMENHSSSGEEQEVVEEEEEEEGKTETTEGDNDNAESTPERDDADQVPQDEGDEDMAAGEETETDVGESSRSVGEKNKKRRNSKVVTNSRLKSQKTMEDNVCFICFDGGDLVLCDRRGCPKAYHPSCVDRDEAFFRSKGRWTCGWHLCHVCKKPAHYMCYTCPHSSVCKGCAKDAAILCVRGNKGFCETCKRTIMLIENGWEGIHDGKKIDFDDKSSWEFLYKDYYADLKSKLSLTSAEIDKAKNPVSTRKEETHGKLVKKKDGGTSSNGAKDLGGARPKRKRAKKKQSLPEDEDSADAAVSVPSNEEWASKELLEFVMHMKDGDRSVVSQFDVQALLLEYITRKNLRDPHKMSQIKCDARLANLFGKRRVGHFEMLKLLESHFLLKEDSHTDDVEDSIVDYDAQVSQLEADENDDIETTGIKEKKRKVRRKSDKGPLSNRLDYAAIDTHNINLIYLRRKLMEDILEEGDDFQIKVVGTFVRIRISGNNQKQDLYRLVQVVGTSKADEPYKFGKRTTDLMLEILNLNKTEIVSIDTISNQDFTEDECKRLRQSIKCGLLNRMTVGDILDKAMELQTARVDDWLESETLRLSHLRDRASDMGHRKELRECVEKLQVLKTPEERLRRLEEIPKIHVDPKMDPNNESEDDESESDDNRQEGPLKTTGSVFGTRRGRAPISPSDVTHKESWNGGNGKSWESSRNFFSKTSPTSGEYASGESSDMVNNNTSWNQGRERAENRANLISPSKLENTGLISNARSRSDSFSGGTTNSLVAFPTKEEENIIKINEAQKMWHYTDPAGKVQGPFSMTQLRKWNNTGYFPNGLKIWKAGENQDVDSIILNDALAGRFQKKSSVDSQLSMAAATRGLSSHYVKTSEPPSQRSMAPSVEVFKPSPEKWSRSDLQNLPSPTPGRSIAGNLLSRTSGNASAPISRDQSMNGQENSAHALQATLLAQLGEGLPVEDRGQNTWGGAPPPNVDSNTLTPVAGQQQAYNQWGAQNPAALPQPEYWSSNNQQNMQTPVMPNMGWVAPAQGPLPTNMNWAPPTIPNTGWAVGPTGDAANLNGGWVTQPSPMGGANAGWVAQPPVANMGPAVQVPVMPGPGWAMPNGNQGPPVQGWNQGWAPDQYGSGGSQGGDSGYGPRPWNNRQSSFGRRPDLRNTRRDMLCPYNANGNCRKGDRCNYIHS